MWFKNIRAYRLTSPFTLSPEQLGEQLAQRGFEPCAKSQALSLGWTPPLGVEDGELVHAAAGRLLVKLKREEKLLPSSVVRELLEEKISEIEQGQARKVYRKERLNLKDEIIQDCLPRAFTRSTSVYAYIDTRSNWIFVDAASAARAEELARTLGVEIEDPEGEQVAVSPTDLPVIVVDFGQGLDIWKVDPLVYQSILFG